MRSVRVAMGMAVLVILVACAVTPQDYAGGQPSFSLRSFFDGPLVAEGIFQNRAGKTISRYRVHTLGSAQGSEGRLDELFTYRDGNAAAGSRRAPAAAGCVPILAELVRASGAGRARRLLLAGRAWRRTRAA